MQPMHFSQGWSPKLFAFECLAHTGRAKPRNTADECRFPPPQTGPDSRHSSCCWGPLWSSELIQIGKLCTFCSWDICYIHEQGKKKWGKTQRRCRFISSPCLSNMFHMATKNTNAVEKKQEARLFVLAQVYTCVQWIQSVEEHRDGRRHGRRTQVHVGFCSCESMLSCTNRPTWNVHRTRVFYSSSYITHPGSHVFDPKPGENATVSS